LDKGALGQLGQQSKIEPITDDLDEWMNLVSATFGVFLRNFPLTGG